jgi:hypothetical protein
MLFWNKINLPETRTSLSLYRVYHMYIYIYTLQFTTKKGMDVCIYFFGRVRQVSILCRGGSQAQIMIAVKLQVFYTI